MLNIPFILLINMNEKQHKKNEQLFDLITKDKVTLQNYSYYSAR